MSTRKITDAKDTSTNELVYFKGHAQATFMSDGRTVEEAINSIPEAEQITVDSQMSETSANPVQNKVLTAEFKKKQDTLVSGTNIKTVNGESILGSGNISISVPTVDAAFSSTSTNAVQNKVVKAAIDELQNKDTQIDAKQAELSAEITFNTPLSGVVFGSKEGDSVLSKVLKSIWVEKLDESFEFPEKWLFYLIRNSDSLSLSFAVQLSLTSAGDVVFTYTSSEKETGVIEITCAGYGSYRNKANVHMILDFTDYQENFSYILSESFVKPLELNTERVDKDLKIKDYVSQLETKLNEVYEDVDTLNEVISGDLGEEIKTSSNNRIGVWLDNTPSVPYRIKVTCSNPPVQKFNVYKASKGHGDLKVIEYDARFNIWIDIEVDAEKPVLYIYSAGAEDTTIDTRDYVIEYQSKESLKERVNLLENPRDLYSYYKNAPKLYNKPLVCFVFDVPFYALTNSLIKEFIDYCDELNLKISIATSTDLGFASTFEADGWVERMQNGHEIVNYPLDTDVRPNVGDFGFGSCDEASVMAIYAKNKAVFDALGIKMDVGIWHNSSVRVPSAVSQVRELYKTIIGGLGNQYIQEMCEDLSCWNRYMIEGSTFDTLKTFFDAVLGQQKVVVFGTHLVTSNGVMLQYDNYINEIKPFLRYLSDLVNDGLIASVSITHALESVQNERAIRNYIPYKRYEFTAPISEIYRTQTAVNMVTNGGKPYVFKLDIVGTASGGAIGISIDGDGGSESKSISVPSGASAEAVAALFYTHAFFSNYRTKVVGSSVYFYRCRTDNADVSFEITSNTSGVTITKTDIVNAVAHSVTAL